MRILFCTVLFAAACGSTTGKTSSPLVKETDASSQCCCKTTPETAEKEIVPVYAMSGRMECSTQNGECVDNVQCNASTGSSAGDDTGGDTSGDTGVPPPPTIEPDSASPAVP